MTTYGRALVTGASSGIGTGFARVLAGRGTHLVLVARRKDRLEELAAELQERYGVEVEVLPADLTDPVARATVEARLAAAPDVDLLVNDAGSSLEGPFAASPPDRLYAEVDLNALVPMRLARAVLPGLLDRAARGRPSGVVNVSSVAALLPVPKLVSYTASKAFVLSLSRSLYADVSRSGVGVTAVLPGITRSELTEDAGLDRLPGFLWLTPEQVAREALVALARGRDVCVPGRSWRAIAGLVRLTPAPLLRAAVRRAR